MERQRILVCVLTVLLFNSCTPVNSLTWDDTCCAVKTYGGTIVVAGVAIVVVPVVVIAVGFTAAVIAAGFLAQTVITNVGGVIAGVVIAALQSAWAAGIGPAGKTVITGVVGGTYRYLAGGCENNDINCQKLQAK